jgi:hypothetical protein
VACSGLLGRPLLSLVALTDTHHCLTASPSSTVENLADIDADALAWWTGGRVWM